MVGKLLGEMVGTPHVRVSVFTHKFRKLGFLNAQAMGQGRVGPGEKVCSLRRSRLDVPLSLRSVSGCLARIRRDGGMFSHRWEGTDELTNQGDIR